MAERSSKKDFGIRNSTDEGPGGAFYLIVVQLLSKVVTFGGNQFVLRYLSLNLLGIAVQLELYSVSVLYFSRESLRVALQRQSLREEDTPATNKTVPSPRSYQTQAIVNLASFAIALGSPLTIGFGWLYYRSQSNNVEIQEASGFGISLVVYAFATIIELFSEPCFVVIQERLLYKQRARYETMAAVLKCVATCLTVVIMRRRQMAASVFPFAVGQAVYATVLASGYLVTVLPMSREDGFSIFPAAIDSKGSQFLAGRFYRPLASLALTLYAQSVFKQILTQGDTFVLGFLTSLEDQGAFALASNYGGLIARIIFQPVEESSRNTFGRLLSSSSHRDRETKVSDLRLAFKQLSDILHFYSIVAVLSSCFLYTILPLSVQVLVGPKWFTTDVAAILSIYCYHIPFMAYNGILDAFVTSVASPAELRRQSMWMAAFTATYIPTTYILIGTLKLGARGLVLGNIFNMLLRIVWSCWFVTRFGNKNNYGDNVIRNLLPRPSVAGVGAVVTAMLRQRSLEYEEGIRGLIEALMICLIGGCTILFLDRVFLMQWISAVLPERLALKFAPKDETDNRNGK